MIQRRTPLKRSTKPIARNSVVRKKRKTARRGRVRSTLCTWGRVLIRWCAGDLQISLSSGDGHQTFTVQITPTEAAHIGERGLGHKCSDRETIPLCAEHHRTGPESHHVLGKSFWKHHGLNKDALVKELNRFYECSSAKVGA